MLCRKSSRLLSPGYSFCWSRTWRHCGRNSRWTGTLVIRFEVAWLSTSWEGTLPYIASWSWQSMPPPSSYDPLWVPRVRCGRGWSLLSFLWSRCFLLCQAYIRSWETWWHYFLKRVYQAKLFFLSPAGWRLILFHLFDTSNWRRNLPSSFYFQTVVNIGAHNPFQFPFWTPLYNCWT